MLRFLENMTALIKSDDTFNVSFEPIGVPSFKQILIYSNLKHENKRNQKTSASLPKYDLIMFIDLKDKWQLIIFYIEHRENCELIFHLSTYQIKKHLRIWRWSK